MIRFGTEAYVLQRLAFAEDHSGVAGFCHADDVRAALALWRKGLVECWEGEGRDRGLLLVRRRAFAPKAPPPPPTAPEGDVA